MVNGADQDIYTLTRKYVYSRVSLCYVSNIML